jgi:hypothetical protein
MTFCWPSPRYRLQRLQLLAENAEQLGGRGRVTRPGSGGEEPRAAELIQRDIVDGHYCAPPASMASTSSCGC